MSAVKARWHVDLDQLGSEVVDLWAEEVEATGLPIDLKSNYAKLSETLTGLLDKEAYLDSQGITCGIKDRQDTSCWACPLYRGETDDPVGSLCIVGREQERVLTRMAVAQEEERADDQGQDAS